MSEPLLTELINAVADFISVEGSCSKSEDDTGYCRRDLCEYCNMARAHQEYQDAKKASDDKR